jgi:nucleoid DNA-binding protein
MTTKELIDRVYRRYGRCLHSREDAWEVVHGMFAIIAEELAADHDVRLDNLGTLAVQSRKKRALVFGKPNPNAGQETRQVTFRDGAPLRRRMNP